MVVNLWDTWWIVNFFLRWRWNQQSSQSMLCWTVGLKNVMNSKPGIYFETAKTLHFRHQNYIQWNICVIFFSHHNSTKFLLWGKSSLWLISSFWSRATICAKLKGPAGSKTGVVLLFNKPEEFFRDQEVFRLLSILCHGTFLECSCMQLHQYQFSSSSNTLNGTLLTCCRRFGARCCSLYNTQRVLVNTFNKAF